MLQDLLVLGSHHIPMLSDTHHLLMMAADGPVQLSSGASLKDVITNLTHSVASYRDPVAMFAGGILFIVGVIKLILAFMGNAQQQRGSKIGWAVAMIVIGASFGISGIADTLSTGAQNTGKNALSGSTFVLPTEYNSHSTYVGHDGNNLQVNIKAPLK